MIDPVSPYKEAAAKIATEKAERAKPAPASCSAPRMMARLSRQEAEYHMHEERDAFLTDEQLEIMNAALGLEKGPYYRPYCLRCDLGPRVALRSFGFECWNCGNKFGFDLRSIEAVAGDVQNAEDGRHE